MGELPQVGWRYRRRGSPGDPLYEVVRTSIPDVVHLTTPSQSFIRVCRVDRLSELYEGPLPNGGREPVVPIEAERAQNAQKARWFDAVLAILNRHGIRVFAPGTHILCLEEDLVARAAFAPTPRVDTLLEDSDHARPALKRPEADPE